jgi:hypothetical protein
MMGLLLGFCAGSFAMGILFYFALTVKCDWNQLASEIRKKMLDDIYQTKDDELGGSNSNSNDLKTHLLH